MESSSAQDSKGDSALSLQTKTSASVQTRLPDASSQYRHRTLANLLPLDKNLLQHEDLDVPYIANNQQTPWINHLWGCISTTLRQRLAQNSRLKWLLLVYCCFCLGFLSSGLFFRVMTLSGAYSLYEMAERDLSSSPLQALPLDYLTSKITIVHPNYQSLQPYVIRATIVEDTVTACLWSDLEDVEMVSTWAKRWQGYISLLVTSRASTLDHLTIASKLSPLKSLQSVNSTLSVHVLHLKPNSPENPNAFLNLARLFAQTATVALFPGNLSVVPGKTFSRSLFSKRLPMKPLIYSMRGETTYPFSALSPLILGRDDSLWCTERFFPYVSRATDWGDCLWQVWLENFGEVEVRPTTDWVKETPFSTTVNSFFTEKKVRRRLSAKYRSETCVLATRQLAALRTAERGLEAKKARWLKRNCRTWTTN